MGFGLNKRGWRIEALFLLVGITLGGTIYAESGISIDPGDTLAADVFRDVIDRLSVRSKLTTNSDLIGEWRVVQRVCFGGSEGIGDGGLCDAPFALEDSARPNGTYYQRDDIWAIDEQAEARLPLLLRSNKSNFLFNPALSYVLPNESLDWYCDVVGGQVLVCVGPESITYDGSRGCGSESCRLHVVMEVSRLHQNHIQLKTGPIDTNEFGSAASNFALFNLIDLVRNTQLPVPQKLRLQIEANMVKLAWESEGRFQGVFEILRKDDLEGEFLVIGETAIQEYVDEEIESTRPYWYRVRTKLGTQVGVGSNVRFAVVE